jgi:hypothetical protein
MRALPAALLAHRRPSLLAPVLAGAFASAILRRPPNRCETSPVDWGPPPILVSRPSIDVSRMSSPRGGSEASPVILGRPVRG